MARRTQSSRALFEFDRGLCGEGEIAGADEAGRGCLAGPLVAAAVVFDHQRGDPGQLSSLLGELKDSKQLTAAARERVYPLIVRYASRLTIVIFSSRTIDAEGLHRTNLKALSRSLRALNPCPPTALVDGRQQLPGGPPHRAVKGGDSLSACIAAASVIAKVTRDRLMTSLHGFYPDYGFDRHMGYGTREHLGAISRHGFCRLHRHSFKISVEAEGRG